MNAKMNEEEIVRAVMEVLKELSPANTGDAPGVEFGASVVSDGEVPDVTATPEQELCLIENCARREELLEMKKRTPARTLTGRVGVRENTLTVLRKRANLAAMVDAVWEPLNREMAESFHFPILKSIPNSKEEYLMRPDLGRQLDQESLKVVRTKLKKSPDVQIVIGEGQSNSALERSMPELLPALLQGLEVNHINYGTPGICGIYARRHWGSDCQRGGSQSRLCCSWRTARPVNLEKPRLLHHLPAGDRYPGEQAYGGVQHSG